MSQQLTIVVTGILYDTSSGRALHVKTRKRGVWEYPGGKVDPTDAGLMEALAREIHEETGFRIGPATLAPILVLGPLAPTPVQLAAGAHPDSRYIYHLYVVTDFSATASEVDNGGEITASVWDRDTTDRVGELHPTYTAALRLWETTR